MVPGRSTRVRVRVKVPGALEEGRSGVAEAW